jgi:hypothetical protein
LRKNHFNSGILTAIVVLCLAFLATGCGDSDDFVITANAPAAATTGNLVFRFQQAAAQQTEDIVPAGTATLRFDLFSTDPPSQTSLVVTDTRVFERVITLLDVPSNVVSVLVTAFDEDGNPLVTLSGSTVVIVGADVEVDLNDATPVTLDSITVSPDPIILAYGTQTPYFNTGGQLAGIPSFFGNGDVQATILGSFSNGSTGDLPITASTTTFSGLQNVANVTATGLFSVDPQFCGNNATATATYTLGSSVQSDDFVVNTSCFVAVTGTPTGGDTVDLNIPAITSPGGYSGGYAGGVIRHNQTIFVVNETSLTFALESPVTGISINQNSGVITASGGITPDTPVFVLVSFTDAFSGLSYTARLELRVNPTDLDPD